MNETRRQERKEECRQDVDELMAVYRALGFVPPRAVVTGMLRDVVWQRLTEERCAAGNPADQAAVDEYRNLMDELIVEELIREADD